MASAIAIPDLCQPGMVEGAWVGGRAGTNFGIDEGPEGGGFRIVERSGPAGILREPAGRQSGPIRPTSNPRLPTKASERSEVHDLLRIAESQPAEATRSASVNARSSWTPP